MKIILFGSIAAGKTCIATKIKEQFVEFEYIAIDDYRRKYGDNTMKGEKLAHKYFLSDINNNKHQIIEASGLGILGTQIFDIISQQNIDVLLVILYINENEIKNRLRNRKWDIPFPNKQDNLNDIITSINYGIQFGRIPMMWSELDNTTIFKIENKSMKTQNFIINTIINYLKLKK